MKYCPKCKLSKFESEFYLRKTGARQGELYEKCKLCMKVRGQQYYHINHDRQLRLANIRRILARKMKHEFTDKLKNKPCADCGKTFPPYVMDFDHRDKLTKISEVAHMVNGNWTIEKIKFEIGKCDLICSNCHRIRTHSHKQI